MELGRATFICMLHYPQIYLTEVDRTVFITSDPFRCRWDFLHFIIAHTLSIFKTFTEIFHLDFGLPLLLFRNCKNSYLAFFFCPQCLSGLPLVKHSVWSFYCRQYLSEVVKLLSVGLQGLSELIRQGHCLCLGDSIFYESFKILCTSVK